MSSHRDKGAREEIPVTDKLKAGGAGGNSSHLAPIVTSTIVANTFTAYYATTTPYSIYGTWHGTTSCGRASAAHNTSSGIFGFRSNSVMQLRAKVMEADGERAKMACYWLRCAGQGGNIFVSARELAGRRLPFGLRMRWPGEREKEERGKVGRVEEQGITKNSEKVFSAQNNGCTQAANTQTHTHIAMYLIVYTVLHQSARNGIGSGTATAQQSHSTNPISFPLRDT